MFKQGDKVSHEQWGAGTVAFGPFRVPETTSPCYLVMNEEGHHFIGSETLLSPVPRFQVGQKVTFQYSRHKEYYEVVAGPFPAIDGVLWVLKDPEGSHDTSYEKYMVPVVE